MSPWLSHQFWGLLSQVGGMGACGCHHGVGTPSAKT